MMIKIKNSLGHVSQIKQLTDSKFLVIYSFKPKVTRAKARIF
jgi:predicted xylose isomerase-like sugar epimerase